MFPGAGQSPGAAQAAQIIRGAEALVGGAQAIAEELNIHANTMRRVAETAQEKMEAVERVREAKTSANNSFEKAHLVTCSIGRADTFSGRRTESSAVDLAQDARNYAVALRFVQQGVSSAALVLAALTPEIQEQHQAYARLTEQAASKAEQAAK